MYSLLSNEPVQTIWLEFVRFDFDELIFHFLCFSLELVNGILCSISKLAFS